MAGRNSSVSIIIDIIVVFKVFTQHPPQNYFLSKIWFLSHINLIFDKYLNFAVLTFHGGCLGLRRLCKVIG